MGINMLSLGNQPLVLHHEWMLTGLLSFPEFLTNPDLSLLQENSLDLTQLETIQNQSGLLVSQ